MIYSKDILFLHVPKTGGMAMTDLLLKVLPRPVFYSHPHEADPALPPDIIQFTGDRHESLPEAREILTQRGCTLEQFRLILAVIRNPYAIEVSRFCYLQNGNAVDRGYNQDLALTGDFERFARDSDDHGDGVRPVEIFYLLDGVRPKNLRVLRQENLAEELSAALATVGFHNLPALPVVNETWHEPFESFYTRAAEESVYRRYHWYFDQGFYPRFDPATFQFAAPGLRYADALKLLGPVCRLGPARKCWEDTWVSGTLRFPVRLEKPTTTLQLEGATPRHTSAPTELVVKIGAREFRRQFPAGTEFAWQIACPLAAHEAIEVELTGSPTFRPNAVDASLADTRELAFRLMRFEFQPATAT